MSDATMDKVIPLPQSAAEIPLESCMFYLVVVRLLPGYQQFRSRDNFKEPPCGRKGPREVTLSMDSTNLLVDSSKIADSIKMPNVHSIRRGVVRGFRRKSVSCSPVVRTLGVEPLERFLVYTVGHPVQVVPVFSYGGTAGTMFR